MPEAPKEVVPEKKVPVAPPKKPEAPPVKGSHPHTTNLHSVQYVSTLSNQENTNIFEVPEMPKAVPQKKIPEAIPPKPESPPPEGIIKSTLRGR